MASSKPLVFCDIASGPPVRSYAPNPWKVRYALNFKRVNFITKWVDLADFASTRKSLGAGPVRFLPNGEPFYTLPVIQDPSTDEVVGDSFDIAVYLDKKYPDGPRLFRQSTGLYAAFKTHFDTFVPIGGALLTDGMPLDPETHEEVQAEMCRRYGAKSTEDLTVHGESRRKVLSGLEVTMRDAAKYWRFSEDPFFGGNEADYADIIMGGRLMFLSMTVPEWEEIRTWHGGVWGKLHEALEPYRGIW
ncbi:hypothetical protein F5Y16DRAFT_114652 [Xylariaceae sp. FL0255]|nr:hypothetical protein F5Y16DRAFT_114652 [Xylariaceae sp. FL0255]